MDNNLDENIINNIKKMVDNGDISSAISQISPEMINNFSKILSSSKEQSSNKSTEEKSNVNTEEKSNSNTYSNFDFNGIDINTILKMKSVMDKMNSSSDPRTNLLTSLKPYLRNEKKEKLDQYANLLKMANVAEVFKNEKKENNNNA